MPLTSKTSNSVAISHVIPFLCSFSKIIGKQVYIRLYKDAQRFENFKLKIPKEPKIGLHG